MLHTEAALPGPTLREARQDGTASALAMVELRKEYGPLVAVDGISLSVSHGEVFGFLGPNGAGKTTAMKMLMGLVSPTSGTATLLGYPIGDLRSRARIGFLPEQFRFHEWMRADEFLDFHARLLGMTAAVRHRHIVQVLEMVGLGNRQKNRLRSFSKGMLQRIGLAQALIGDPELVFLDEPTSALDPIGRRDVRDIIRALKSQGVTVFLNSHLLSEIEQVCDRVVIVNHGRIVREGRVESLLHQQLELELEVEPVTQPLLAALAEICAHVRVERDRLVVQLHERGDIPRVAETVIGAGARLYRLQGRSLSLEDLFVETVGESGDH